MRYHLLFHKSVCIEHNDVASDDICMYSVITIIGAKGRCQKHPEGGAVPNLGGWDFNFCWAVYWGGCNFFSLKMM